MTPADYKKQLNALNRAFYKANNPYQYGEVVLYHGRKLVLLDPVGINVTSGCKIMYDYRVLSPTGTLDEKVERLYGFETIKPTGEVLQLEEDLC